MSSSDGPRQTTYDPDDLIRKEQVMKMTSLPKTTLYRLINKGEFPKQMKLGQRTAAWRYGDVKQWINTRAGR